MSIFETAPTAIRSLMTSGDALVARNDLSRLRILGSAGEPLNPEAWRWMGYKGNENQKEIERILKRHVFRCSCSVLCWFIVLADGGFTILAVILS